MTDPDPTTAPVEYREIPGYPGYRVGDDGSVWSRWSGTGMGRRSLGTQWRPLKQSKTSSDYWRVTLGNEAGKRIFRVHQVVLMGFTGPRPEGHVGCHNNGNHLDNRPSNLRWDTQLGNLADMRKHGTALLGTKRHNAQLTEAVIPEIRRLSAAGMKCTAIAPLFGVAPSVIVQVVSGRTWSHVPSAGTDVPANADHDAHADAI